MGLVLPHLQGKLDGVAIRVPLANASITDLTLNLAQDVDTDTVNAALLAASRRMPLILGYEVLPLVSIDYKDDPRSAVVDASTTKVLGKRMVQVLAWYDNEFGYSMRMVDLFKLLLGQEQ